MKCLLLFLILSVQSVQAQEAPPNANPAVNSPANAADQVSLPADAVAAPQVIYHSQHQLEGKNELNAQFSYLYGDKYLNTMGVLIDDRYHFSDNWAASLGIGLYKSSESSELSAVQNTPQEPYVYDPTFLTKATAIYDPFYGKILMGTSIVHFRLDTEFGLQYTKNSTPSGSSYSTSFSRAGPMIGFSGVFYTSNKITVSLGPDLLLTGSAPGDTSSGMRKIWLFNFGAGVVF
jgi:hypothetical protein